MDNQGGLRILHVTRVPVTVTAFLLPILESHRARGDHACVACTDGPEIKQIEEKGFPVHRYRLGNKLAPWSMLAGIRDLARIMRDQKIDWLFTHTPIASGLSRIASRFAPTKGTVYLVHGFPFAPQMNPLTWYGAYLCERMLGRWTDGLITMNRYDTEHARTRGIIRNPDMVFRINGMGVDTGKFDELCKETDGRAVKEELGLPPDSPMILMLARTCRVKGVIEYVEAARILAGRGVDAQFALAGSGPLDDEIATLVERYGLKTRFAQLGWRRDAPRLVAACDLFALPTYFTEGLPVSILEAMACGKPIVATRHRGCEDAVVEGETGILIEPKDPEALANAIQDLMSDTTKAQRLGHAGRARAREHFTLKQSTEAAMTAFAKITESSRR